MSNVKITSFEIENCKRVKAVRVNCEGAPLTIIGGKNGQGKTSILDAILWAAGGDRFKPSNPVNTGADKSYIKLDFDNGVTVERKGINAALKITSANGKGGQALLNEFVNVFALNLPKFMQATAAEKTGMLLEVFPGLGAELERLKQEIKRIFDERHATGVIADRKRKYASELPFDFDAPAEVLSGSEMVAKLQTALSKNAQNQKKRASVSELEGDLKAKQYAVQTIEGRIKTLEESLNEARQTYTRASMACEAVREAIDLAKLSARDLEDIDTTVIQQELEDLDAINAQVRSNESKRNAEAEAAELQAQYVAATEKLEEARGKRAKLLSGVAMPLPGLSIDDQGLLIFNGRAWDCMSGAEQLRVAAAICSAVNPKCGFVLLDKLEALDGDSLAEFKNWLIDRDMQAIGTKVSDGDECSIIIENGEVIGVGDEVATKEGEEIKW